MIFIIIFLDNRGRASPDRKKSILKRSGDTMTGGGGCGSTSVGSTSAGALSDHTDTEMEKLIGGGGATASESGSEPFSPIVGQRSSRPRMTDGLLLGIGGGGNKTNRKPCRASTTTPDSIGHISVNMGGGIGTTSCALDDWPFADYSPTDEAINSAATGGHPSAT